MGLRAPVRAVGVGRDGQMALPPDPDVVGWYRYGPGTGEDRGAVVLAGHLDTDEEGVGPLVRLRYLSPGDRVVVTSGGAQRHTYRVARLARYDRQALPRRLFARAGNERLHLITCGGDYDAREGGYQENLVVTARPI